MGIVEKDTQERTYTLREYHCHCDSSNALDYMIYEDEKEYVPIQDKTKGKHIVESLNFFEKNIVGKIK
jgi:hypothetical protein